MNVHGIGISSNPVCDTVRMAHKAGGIPTHVVDEITHDTTDNDRGHQLHRPQTVKEDSWVGRRYAAADITFYYHCAVVARR